MDNGIVLVGQAAESFVRLQWVKFFACIPLIVSVMVCLGIFIYCMWKERD